MINKQTRKHNGKPIYEMTVAIFCQRSHHYLVIGDDDTLATGGMIASSFPNIERHKRYQRTGGPYATTVCLG